MELEPPTILGSSEWICTRAVAGGAEVVRWRWYSDNDVVELPVAHNPLSIGPESRGGDLAAAVEPRAYSRGSHLLFIGLHDGSPPAES